MPTFYNFTQDGLRYSFDDVFVKADPFRQGNLWNWGRGVAGALGNYTGPSFVSTPTTTFVGGSNWKQVSTGGLHTVAVKTDGTLWTWGYNRDGQLGNASTTIRDTPVTTFSGGTDWKQVEGGCTHTVAIKIDGTLWTWGQNDQGQLGVYGRVNSSTPITTFVGGTNWKSIAAGYSYSSAIKTDGTLWSWGYAYFGQLGTGPTYTPIRSTPQTTFAGGTNWADTPTTNPEDLYTLSAGNNHTAAIKTDGTLWTWGEANVGKLGNGATATSGQNFVTTPITTFAGGTNWKQVSGSGDYKAAIKTDGTLWTWGFGSSGQLGNAVTTISISTPITTFAGGTNWKQVSGGGSTMAAIKTDGTLWTWGNGTNGRLGNGVTTGNISTPITTFAGGTNWKQVSTGGAHTTAIRTDGTLWAWGRSLFGGLGNAAVANSSTPVTTFAGGTNWKQVSSGGYHTAAIKTDGTLWIWGGGPIGTLGNTDGGNSSTPVTTFAGGTNWKQVSAGNRHTAAIKTDGTLWTWGIGETGELGNANGFLDFDTPTEYFSASTPITTFAGGNNWTQVIAGNSHTTALNNNNQLYTWGYARYGQLGDTFYVQINDIPRKVGGDTNWKQVSCSYHSSAAVKTDGTLWTWGANGQAQLGTSKLYQSSAEPITTFAGGTDWKQVSAGGYYTVNMMAAIKNDGTLWTWGNGYYGILGNAKAPLSSAPDIELYVSTPITTFAGGATWKQVSCGGYHMAAVKTNGTLWTWGSDTQDQLGTGYQFAQAGITYASTPVTTFLGGSNWKSVGSSGGYRVCAIESVDPTYNLPDLFSLFTWGYGQLGQLGNNDVSGDRSTPVTTFAGGSNWRQISSGREHVAAIKIDGTLWTWGRGFNGVLGTRDTINRSTPVTTFAGGTNWKQVSVGNLSHIAAIKTDGTLWTWGNGQSGVLGNGITTGIRSTPVTTFAGGTNWKQVSAKNAHTAAIKTDGTLWIWGPRDFGKLGNATISGSVSTPVTTFTGGTNWKQVSVGGDHTTAIKTDGTLWTWGFVYGSVSSGFNVTISTPVTTFAGGTNWRYVSAGDLHSAATKTDGTLWTWGYESEGQLGTNGTINSNSYTPVTTFAGGTNWRQVSANRNSTAAIKTDGTLWTWGDNAFLQLGNATTTNRSTPVTTFAGGTNWEQVSSGSRLVAAIAKN